MSLWARRLTPCADGSFALRRAEGSRTGAMAPSVDLVVLQLVIERASRDREDLGGARLVAARGLERREDHAALALLEREGGLVGRGRGELAARALADLGRQVVEADPV